MDVRHVDTNVMVFVGDAVYEVFVRDRIVKSGLIGAGRLLASTITLSTFSLKLGILTNISEDNYGLGIRVKTPFGNLRLDYAYGDDENKTYFGFGEIF